MLPLTNMYNCIKLKRVDDIVRKSWMNENTFYQNTEQTFLFLKTYFPLFECLSEQLGRGHSRTNGWFFGFIIRIPSIPFFLSYHGNSSLLLIILLFHLHRLFLSSLKIPAGCLYIKRTLFIYTVIYSFNKYLKGHGHDFGQFLFFFLYFLQCFRNAFLMIKRKLKVSLWVISKIHGSQFFVILTRLVPCFCFQRFNIPI